MVLEISYLKKKYPVLRKVFSKIIPFGSLILLLLVIITWILWVFYPHSWAFFVLSFIIIIFYIWWLIRWFEYVILLLAWLFRYKSFQKLNLDNIFLQKPASKLEAYYVEKIKKSNFKKNDIFHWVIIPTYQDPLEMILDSINSIKNTTFDNKKIIITLAWEKRDQENFYKIKEKVSSIFKDDFLDLNFTLHEEKPWELVWKWANVSFAAKSKYKEVLSKVWLNSENKILVSVLDSESILQDRYFDVLTLEYLITSPDMQDKTIYQPMLFLTNRFFSAPYFSQIIALSVWFYILWASLKWIWARAQAVQAQSLKSLIQTDFYSVETITEDGHQYYRTYCTFNWKFQVKPFYAYVLLEPVIWKTFFESLKLQYNQIKRWAHGCLDFPYIVLCFLDKFKKLPKLRTLYEIFWLLEASVLRSSLQFILFFWGIFLAIIGEWYSNLFLIFNVLAILILSIILIISLFFLPWYQIESKRRKIYEMVKYSILSFTLMWPLLLVLNWLPALHAQILILFWKPMWKFNVTKKYRDL